MSIPVALFVYNRPSHTQKTISALANNVLASDTDLYIFCDGQKNETDNIAVEAVRLIVRAVSGFASVTLIEHQSNFGLAKSVISGVTSLLEKFDSVIVLEDDLVTSRYFLSYMNSALAHYKNDLLAFSVTGYTFPEKYLRIPADYPYDTYAGHRCSSWSWGTWRDRWQRIDWDMHYYPAFNKSYSAQEEFNRGGQDLTTLLRMQHDGQIDSWAIRFCYAHYSNGMKCIYPIKTLVMNIGLDNTGTHSRPDARFVHTALANYWLPEKFCDASNLDPVISERFCAVWGGDNPGLFRLFLRKLKSNFLNVLRKVYRVGSRIIRLIRQPLIDVEVVVVNTYQKNGGAARAAYRMFTGIRKVYTSSVYLTLFKDDSSHGVIGLLTTSIRGFIAQRLVRRDQAPLHAYAGRPATFFTPAQHANMLRIRLLKFRSKLVHLHWVGHSMLRVEEIGKLKCPVVWTLHDAWPFTGGCHYTGNCNGYKKSCGDCPQLSSQKSNDISHLLWLRKKESFANINLTIVTPSNWLADIARQSSLFSGRRIEVIPNGLNIESFKPVDKNIAKQYFALPENMPVLLFGAHWLEDPRKGSDLLYQALSQLDFPFTLLTFGEGILQLDNLPRVTVRALGLLSDDISLAMMYSAADVFICPSREDNLPNTVTEALACGTPCAAFNTCGFPDMIDHKENGWLAKSFDSSDLAEGIKWLVQHPHPVSLQQAARNHAVAQYSMDVMTQRYSKLYAELLEAGQK